MTLRTGSKGFLIMEVLVVISMLAVAFTFFMGAMAQVARLSQKSARITDAISKFEPLFFQIESGLRPDLAGYGGRGDLGDDHVYRFEKVKDGEYVSWLKNRLSWKGGREAVEFEAIYSKAPAQ